MSKNEVISRLEALLARVRTRSVEPRARTAHGVAAHGVAAQPAQPVATKPVAANPVPAKPVAVKPVAANPVAAKPVAAKPVAAKPFATPPVATFAATEPSMPAVAFAPAATEPSMPAVAFAPAATEPSVPVVTFAPAATEPSMPAVIAASVAPAPPAPPPATAPALPLPLDEDATFAAPKRTPPQVAEPDIVVDVDVQETTKETVIGLASEEPVVPESAESRERLVAAEPVGLDAGELSTAPAQLESLPPGDVEASAEEEAPEEGPASSRRPVAPQPEEQLADMAFGSEEPAPPRHTPPPESGRLPAAPIVEFDGDVTGVRDAQPIPHAVARAASVATELEPQATRPAILPSEDVADVLGEAQRFSPATFVALLDASLAL